MSTYEILAEFRRVVRARLFRPDLRHRLRLRAVAVPSATLRRSRPHSLEGGLIHGRRFAPSTRQMLTPAPRRPAMNGTASRSSTRRCRAGGCRPSTPASSGRSATGWSIRPGRCWTATPRAWRAGTRAPRSSATSRNSRRCARPMNEKLAKALARGDREDAGVAVVRARAGRGGVRDQLRAVPRRRRPGLARLPQPQRRPLALGRHAREIATTITHGARWEADPDTHPT